MSRFLLVLFFSLVISACIAPVGSAPTTSPAPEATIPPQPKETQTSTPTPPELNVSDDIKQILEGTEYTVSPDGEPVIEGKSFNPFGIVKEKVENVTLVDIKEVTNTNFNGAEIIKYGYDKNDKETRYVYVENSGWVKYVEGGTADNPIEIPANYVDDGILNTITAFKYTENPTLPETETKPTYEFYVYNNPSSGIGGGVRASYKELNNVQRQQVFDYHGVFKFLGKDGQWKYILPMTFQNSIEGNQDQLTNVFGGLTQAEFDHLTKDLKSQTTGESLLSFTLNRTYQAEPWLEVPKKASWDSSAISALYPPDTLLNLFPQDDIDAITASFTKQDTKISLSPSETIIQIDGIPTGFSTKVVPLHFN